MNQTKYDKVIRSVGKKLIDLYKERGHVSSGINGPYDDPETEVRNLAHLIVIVSIECLKFGITEYRDLVIRMADELLAMKSENGIYKMRQKEGKDQCNGVIGHAWLVEGLIYAYRVTSNHKYIKESIRICRMHIFQPKLGLWGRPLMGNRDNAIDVTLNHQLWYAATLSELNSIINDEEFCNELDIFMRLLPKNFSTNKSGRISHVICNRMSIKEHLKQIIKEKFFNVKESLNKSSYSYKEEGYHMFNLMALARLYIIDNSKSFYGLSKFSKAIKYVNSSKFILGLNNSNIDLDASLVNLKLTQTEKKVNIYGYSYNVPGFEILYVNEVYGKYLDNNVVCQCIKEQMLYTFDDNTYLFGKCVHDTNTVNYRIYEYYRYLEIS